MSDFKASNGCEIGVSDSGGLRVFGSIIRTVLTPSEADALREFFQHERDEQLGRWRWPENPNYVVYPCDEFVRVMNEKEAEAIAVLGPDDDRQPAQSEFDEFRVAVNAYFDAHPQLMPWHDAKPGEVWVLKVDGGSNAYIAKWMDGREQGEKPQRNDRRTTEARSPATRRLQQRRRRMMNKHKAALEAAQREIDGLRAELFVEKRNSEVRAGYRRVLLLLEELEPDVIGRYLKPRVYSNYAEDRYRIKEMQDALELRRLKAADKALRRPE